MLAVLWIAAAIGAVVLLAAFGPGRVYRRFRGTRLVTCPETGRSAAVHVNARGAAATAWRGGAPRLRLRDCSRWPGRRECGQECLEQIEQAPEDCLVRAMLERWYAGSACVACGRAIPPLGAFHHAPGFMTSDGRTLAWSEIAPETLPDVMATHFPVCWDCHVLESLARAHPDLVTDRSGIDRGEMGQLPRPPL